MASIQNNCNYKKGGGGKTNIRRASGAPYIPLVLIHRRHMCLLTQASLPDPWFVLTLVIKIRRSSETLQAPNFGGSYSASDWTAGILETADPHVDGNSRLNSTLYRLLSPQVVHKFQWTYVAIDGICILMSLRKTAASSFRIQE